MPNLLVIAPSWKGLLSISLHSKYPKGHCNKKDSKDHAKVQLLKKIIKEKLKKVLPYDGEEWGEVLIGKGVKRPIEEEY